MIFIKVTDLFNLSESHEGIEFVNVDTETDTSLFIDPFSIKFSKLFTQAEIAFSKIDSFFNHVYRLYDEDRAKEALDLFVFSRESNELHLGYSNRRKSGKGVSKEILHLVFSTLRSNREIADEMSIDPLSLVIFVPNFAEDRMTDLITSIIKKELLEFTLSQAIKHRKDIDYSDYDYGYYWNEQRSVWERLIGPSVKDEVGNALLLVPKDIVVNKYAYSAVNYMNKIILPSMQDEHVRNESKLVRKEVLSDGTIVLHKPTLKTLYKVEVQEVYDVNKTKRFLLDRTLAYPDYYFDYTDKITSGRQAQKLSDKELDELTK